MTLSSNGAPVAGAGQPAIRTMEYPVMPGGGPLLAVLPEGDAAADGAADLEQRILELESRLREREQEFARHLESVRREAAEQGRRAAAGEHEAWRKRCETALGGALEALRNVREEFLARVEHEVVRLALAIAERILQREAEMDPLLLSGVVRVALRRLAESTAVRLRVPAAERELWAEMLRLMPGLPLQPEVVADGALAIMEAVLEADIGSVDLGVRAQMGEIERGFFGAPEARTADDAARLQ
ncbi:MAG TPA: FliH/SctL family protein [Acidobacteriaceae bacterium]|nr:FliH/SctL family protein [Acidobacteriaceae bacterium]